MRFHFPSFWFHFERRMHETDFDVYHHHRIIYVVTSDDNFSRVELLNVISDALLDALTHPIAEPHSRTWRADMIAGPLPGHVDALADALLYRSEYVTESPIQTAAGERWEFRIDTAVLGRVLIETRQRADLEIGKQAVQGELRISIHLMQLMIYHKFGRAFGEKRVREMLKNLERAKVIKGNGHLRTYGRDVL